MPAPKKTTTKTNASKAAKAQNSQNGAVAVAEAPQSVNANNNLNNKAAKTNATTQIVAQIDVGFGNFVAIRGEGAGLNWNSGQKMTYQNNAWNWSGNAQNNFQFKVLLNDQVWAQGENLTAKAGTKNVFKPQF